MSDWDEERENAWLAERHQEILKRFEIMRVEPPRHLRVEVSLAPVLSLWSESSPDGSRQMWVIAGDCPIDSIVFEDHIGPRNALLAFHARWREVAEPMRRGQQHPTIRLGDPNDPESLKELAEMLLARADFLEKMAHDEDLWE